MTLPDPEPEDLVQSILMSPKTQYEAALEELLDTGKVQIGPFTLDFG